MQDVHDFNEDELKHQTDSIQPSGENDRKNILKRIFIFANLVLLDDHSRNACSLPFSLAGVFYDGSFAWIVSAPDFRRSQSALEKLRPGLSTMKIRRGVDHEDQEIPISKMNRDERR